MNLNQAIEENNRQQSEIDRLRAELERVSMLCDQETDRACDEGVLATKMAKRAEKAEARLAVVLALRDQTFLCECIEKVCVRFSDVRAAATGETC